jgi:hypothetical protein
MFTLLVRLTKKVEVAIVAKVTVDFENKNIQGCLKTIMNLIFECFKREEVFGEVF